MRIRIVEVGPRDGLQNEERFIPTEIKIAFVNALSRAGLPEIEVSSFVSPRWVPQLADASEVFAAISRAPGVVYSALVPNMAGLERASAAKVDKIAVFTAASETFNMRNTNATIENTLRLLKPVVEAAGTPVRGYISTAFHCPYEGKIAPRAVSEVAAELEGMGCSELSIGDTIGKANPDDVKALLDELLANFPAERLAMHFHDTFGQAVQNARAAAELGVATFDSSTGGIGGCPFAPGATGNVSTESLLSAFEGSVEVDAAAIDDAAALIRPHLAGAA